MTRQIKFVKGEMYEFELYPLVDSYDTILKTSPKAFDFNAHGASQLAKFHAISLLETMSKKHGVGLAANQVGLDVRMFVMGSEGVGYAFFNPEIVDVAGQTTFEEGCLSFPGLFLPIRRPEMVKIKYFDMNGEEKTQEFSGLSARIVLHEYDHMEGIVYTSKVSPLILERCKRKVKKNLKLLAAQYERIEKEAIIRQAAEQVIMRQQRNLSKEETEYLMANPNATPEQMEADLKKLHANDNVASPKRDIGYAKPPVEYLGKPIPKENKQQDQLVTIDTTK